MHCETVQQCDTATIVSLWRTQLMFMGAVNIRWWFTQGKCQPWIIHGQCSGSYWALFWDLIMQGIGHVCNFRLVNADVSLGGLKSQPPDRRRLYPQDKCLWILFLSTTRWKRHDFSLDIKCLIEWTRAAWQAPVALQMYFVMSDLLL